MSVKSAHRFECDYQPCSRTATVETTSGERAALPERWVLIASMQGSDLYGGDILVDGATFCGSKHASEWFTEQISPLQEAEAGAEGAHP